MNLLLLNKRVWVDDDVYMYLPGIIAGIEGNKLKVEVWVNGKKEYRFIKEEQEVVEMKQTTFCIDDLLVLDSISQEYLLTVMRRRFYMNNYMTMIGKNLALWVNNYDDKSNNSKKKNESNLALIREYCEVILNEKTKKTKKMIIMNDTMANSRNSIDETVLNDAIVLFGQSLSGKSKLSAMIIETLIEITNNNDNSNAIIATSLEIIRLFNQSGSQSKSCLSINLTVDINNHTKIACMKITPFIILLNHMIPSTQSHINFNIFNMLIDTMNEKDKERFYHKPRTYFNSLASSYIPYDTNNATAITSLDKLNNFLLSLSIHQESLDTLFSILMSILYLGNLKFMKDPSNDQVDIYPQCKDDFKAISSLLSIELSTLKALFSTCKDTTEAYLLLNKLITHFYRQIMIWLINQFNNYFNEKEKEYTAHNSNYSLNKKTITIFDSIGYSNNPINSIDDFVGNYCNERLIELFSKSLIGIEQDEYKRESLQWKDIDYYNNAEIINLIDNKGLIDLLDAISNEAMMASTIANDSNVNDYDKMFYTKTYQSYSNSIALGIKSDSFITINHSFGDIYYHIDGFVNRNIKTLPIEVSAIFETSKNTFINQMFNHNQIGSNESLMKHYKKQIDEFITILSHSNLKFIRCFRSNILSIPTSTDDEQEKEFNNQVINAQLITSNIVQVSTFIKKRFNHKISFNDFIINYAYLHKEALKLVKEIQPLSSSASFKTRRLSKAMTSTATTIINHKVIANDIIILFKKNKTLQSKLSNLQIGLTMIYMDNSAFDILNMTKNNICYIRILQRNLRKLLNTIKYAKFIQQKYKKYIKGKIDKKILELKQKRSKNSEHYLTPNIINNPICNTARAFSTQKMRQKSVLNILTKDKHNNQVEAELLQIIKTLQDEISSLKNYQIENETLKSKNTSLLIQITSMENDKIKCGEERDSNIAQRNSTSKSALALITEISALKKKIKENDIKIETQQISLQQNNITIDDLKKLNTTLQEQISTRSKGDLNELNQLIERISIMEQEKKDYKIKEHFNADLSNRQMPLTERNGPGGKDNRNSNDYKKTISALKTELKHTKNSFDELKANYIIEIDKTKALTEQLKILNKQSLYHNWLKTMDISNNEILISLLAKNSKIKKSHSNKHDLLLKDNEIALLKEQLSTCIEKHHKIEEAYKEQLQLKSTNINSLQESLNQQMDHSIQRRKEMMNMKSNQMTINTIDHDNLIRKKNEEVKLLKEILERKKKICCEVKGALKKKKNVIQKKKEENCLLVELFKNKKAELQCVEGLRYANSTSIKEKLMKVQDYEKELIKKVEEIIEDDDYSDDNNNYEDEDEEENKENNDGFLSNEYVLKPRNLHDEIEMQQHSSIDSFKSNDEDDEDKN